MNDGNPGLKEVFRYGKNLTGTVYSRPTRLRGHGQHRHFYFAVALKERLDMEIMEKVPTKEKLGKECEEKILG